MPDGSDGSDARRAAEALFAKPEDGDGQELLKLDPEQLRGLIALRERFRAEENRRTEQRVHLERVKNEIETVRDENRQYTGFLRNCWHLLEPGARYLPNWHIDAIGEHLEAIHKKQIQRFMCNMPPGMMKSTTLSVVFPAWEWGPKKSAWIRYFSTTYEASYARRDSRKHRDLIETEWYRRLYPEVVLEKRAEEAFTNTYKGYRVAVPMARMTAGRGNRFMVDDPHSLDGAESENERDKNIRRFLESGSSRLNDQSNDCIMVIMQRLHPEDLCGKIEELGLPYVKLILPMEYVRSVSVKTPWFTDPRTTEGELLHPAFMNAEKVAEKKVEVGEHGWATQYQQQPRSRAGSSFFHLNHILEEVPLDLIKGKEGGTQLVPSVPPRQLDVVFAVADTATKLGKNTDGTGAGWFGMVIHPRPKLWVLDWDIIKVQADLLEIWMPQVIARGEELAREYHSRTGFGRAYIEDKDSGQVLLQQMRRKKQLVEALPSEFTALGKEGRALSVSGYANRGLCKVSPYAYDKTVVHKGKVKNHFTYQVTGFRMGKGTPDDADELFDIFCYALHIAFEGAKGV